MSIEEMFDGTGGYRPGAMTWWNHQPAHPELDTDPRPRPHLAVMTPAGIACLDCPAASDPAQPGRYWARTGIPPDVTATPSLHVLPGRPDSWHGYLTSGTLNP